VSQQHLHSGDGQTEELPPVSGGFVIQDNSAIRTNASACGKLVTSLQALICLAGAHQQNTTNQQAQHTHHRDASAEVPVLDGCDAIFMQCDE